MKRVKVIWIDSEGTGDWTFKENIKLKVGKCISTGFIVKEDKDYICVTHSFNKSNKTVMGFVTIPKCCILKIKRYKK